MAEIDIAQTEESKKVDIRRYIYPIGIIILVLLLDQILKIWVKTSMYPGEEIRLIGDWAILHFTENNGIAFGLELPGQWGKLILTIFRIIAASAIFAILLSLIKRKFPMGFLLAAGLVFAGATGNIVDSIFYGVAFEDINHYPSAWFQGRVVDMFYFPIVSGFYPDWVPFVGGNYFEFFQPVFNIADAAITTGILWIIFFHRESLKNL